MGENLEENLGENFVFFCNIFCNIFYVSVLQVLANSFFYFLTHLAIFQNLIYSLAEDYIIFSGNCEMHFSGDRSPDCQ
jgi:hypothetical protein